MATHAPLPVIVNRSGGAARRIGAALGRNIEAAFAAADCAIALELTDGAGLARALSRHREAPRLVIGGGDGSLATAAGVVAGGERELAILPLGTRNHFARALDIPLELIEAAALAAHGTAKAVDIGEAGTKAFINNASMGAYVDLLRERESSPLPRPLASLGAAFAALRRLRARRFDLGFDGKPAAVDTPLLFIGNNRYELAAGDPSRRARLDRGLLWCYAPAQQGRLALIVAALRILVGRPRLRRDLVLEREAREIVIAGPGADVGVAFDGESCRCALPLAVRIRPRALRVVVPAPSRR